MGPTAKWLSRSGLCEWQKVIWLQARLTRAGERSSSAHPGLRGKLTGESALTIGLRGKRVRAPCETHLASISSENAECPGGASDRLALMVSRDRRRMAEWFMARQGVLRGPRGQLHHWEPRRRDHRESAELQDGLLACCLFRTEMRSSADRK